LTETRCRLCGDGKATISYTDDTHMVHVKCERCGAFQVEVAGYRVSITELTEDKRREIQAWVGAEHKKGAAVPVITAERLQLLIDEEKGQAAQNASRAASA
jgi:hypothetical protein